ncbi:MAG: 3-oxoacyl-ACP synthase III [Planctomycetaceae bacterium]|nr:3-oxoacyl-ACP synthase III [Planctomycetaceae bacterium]
MFFRHVCLESISYVKPAEIISTADLESQLAEVYDRLHLPAGRLELMTGIVERRFFPPGSKPGPISALATQLAIEASEIPLHRFGALIHGSVCRDQMEPATANLVHHIARLPASTMVLDVSNACLGLLNGAVLLAQMIELGQIQAGVVVGAELGRDLVEGTIDSLKNDPELTRKSIKPAIASLTIGSASTAMVLCDSRLSQHGTKFLGGEVMCDTDSHELCAGGVEQKKQDDHRPRMDTDSEALLEAGVRLAEKTWQVTKKSLGWSNENVSRVFTHQVGKAHRKLMLENLGLPNDCDYPIYDRFGNTGSAALPLSLALGAENGVLKDNDQVALLSIGGGLNSLMLGLDWHGVSIKGTTWDK